MLLPRNENLHNRIDYKQHPSDVMTETDPEHAKLFFVIRCCFAVGPLSVSRIFLILVVELYSATNQTRNFEPIQLLHFFSVRNASERFECDLIVGIFLVSRMQYDSLHVDYPLFPLRAPFNQCIFGYHNQYDG